jgi:glutamine synthetase
MTVEATHDPGKAHALLRENGVDTLIVGGSDTHGIMRGKRVPAEQIGSALEHGVHICDVLWVIDVAETDLVAPPDEARGYFPTVRVGYPDLLAVPDLATLRPVPWHERTALVIADFATPGGEPVPISPRTALLRLVERARTLGLEPLVGVELEFYVLRETEETLHGKRATELVPLALRPSTYGVVKGSSHEQFVRTVRDAMRDFQIPLEGCNPETGPGQFEINLRYAPALEAADRAFLFKNAVKEIAVQQGLTATFMAKPHPDWAGNSCHVHLSLLDRGGENAFADGSSAHGMSRVMGAACAGILATLPAFTAFQAPTINAYRRFHPYSWAGTTVTWGIDNRTVGVRAICEDAASTRLEHRQGGGDANPYLAAAAMLAGALHGIENELEPPAPRGDDVYALPSGAVDGLPASLGEAVSVLERSDAAREYLGADLVDHYVAMKRGEVEAAGRAVTDWEIERYLEAL